MNEPGVRVVARWDVAAVRRAVTGLHGVLEGLPAWRQRLDRVAEALAAGSVWSGAAASGAAVVVTELATTVWVVASCLRDSVQLLDRLAGEAAPAAELAEEALVLAGMADVALAANGSPVVPLPVPTTSMAPDQSAVLLQRLHTGSRATACAEQALGHAALVMAAAVEAGRALRVLGVRGPAAPVDFTDLAAAVWTARSLPAQPVPPGAGPREAARWWASLPPGARAAALAAEPASLGELDGLPAEVRDQANRRLLAAALADPHVAGHQLAVVVAAQLAGQECGRTVQLYEFDPAAGLVAVSLGDLDTAAAIGVLVPGMNTTPERDLGSVLGEAHRVLDAAGKAGPGTDVATVAWLGYRSPQWLQAATTGAARRGGAALDRTLTGLAAGREASGAARPRVTVVAHSYGTVVAHEAAHRPGRLAADAVVLMGSPGMGWDGARGLEAPEVYDAWSPADEISDLGWFGQEPQEGAYGASELPVDPGTPHTGYYDAARPTVPALGRVLVGTQPR